LLANNSAILVKLFSSGESWLRYDAQYTTYLLLIGIFKLMFRGLETI